MNTITEILDEADMVTVIAILEGFQTMHKWVFLTGILRLPDYQNKIRVKIFLSSVINPQLEIHILQYYFTKIAEVVKEAAVIKGQKI